MSFLAELKRRNVLRMAGLYLVGAWLVTQVVSTVLPMFDAPHWLPRSIVVVLAVGFVPALIFAWVFELTPEGLKREVEVDRSQSITPQTGERMDRIIMVVLAIALAYFAFDKFVMAPRREVAVQQQTDARVTEALKQGGINALIQSFGDRSIAVMPFVNMSADPEQEYFSDGISEELLNQLARVPQLRVIARTSSFSFKGKEADVATIAGALNVAHILEGSIRKSGNRVRITAQLIRTADSSHLWSQAYDREMTDIFAVQDDISAAVVAQLKLKLLGAPTARTVDPRAYELFLQALALQRLRSADGYSRAVALLQQAVAIDPAYAVAWMQLGAVYGSQADNGLRPAAEGNRLAREAANKAIAINPEYAPAYAQLAWISMVYDGDLAAAALHLTRALALSPNDAIVLNASANLTQSLGRVQPAIALRERLTAGDPANRPFVANLAWAYYQSGRWEDAMARWREAQVLSPGAIGSRYFIGMALLQLGQPQAALAEMELEPESFWRRVGPPMAWHTLGDRARSDAALAELTERYEKDAAYNIAYVHAWRGEADQAFAWLDKAVAYQDGGLSEIVLQPEFANIRDDPRWLPFLHTLGKAPEQLAAIEFDVELPRVGAAD